MISASSHPNTQDAQDSAARDRAAEEGFPIDMAAGTAGGDFVRKADDLASHAGSAIEAFAQTISERLPHEGVIGQASQAVAESLQRTGRYIETAKFSGTGASIEKLVRRYPYESVFAGIAAGYLFARLLRK